MLDISGDHRGPAGARCGRMRQRDELDVAEPIAQRRAWGARGSGELRELFISGDHGGELGRRDAGEPARTRQIRVFVLTDGRRFRCSGPTFARSTPTPSALERASACVTMRSVAVPASVRAVLARIAAERSCLTSKGLRVSGGPVFPQQGPNSADGELATAGALIAFYDDQRKAARLEPEVEQNARRFGGQVVRNGAVTVLWIHPPASGLRDAVSGCAFG